jgi:predicted RNA-binding Zn-ribbon protein involved in translation (DUF1610 family)
MSRHKKPRINYSQSFICEHCVRAVEPASHGSSHRNHCPHCLHSRHVDIRIGDRRSSCKGTMVPIGIWIQDNKEWSLIHRCDNCGFIRTNRIASDDNEMLLFALAAKPISQMPFPAGKIIDRLQSDLKGVAS